MSPTDYVIVKTSDAAEFEPLARRSFRAGLLGFTLEEALQAVLEIPDVFLPIPGNGDAEDSGRFVVLCREMPLRGWSVDHLLTDREAVPTIVEAKLIENREARRSVIGQMLEYAANINAWTAAAIRERAEIHWRKRGSSVVTAVRKVFGDDVDIELLWSRLDQNIRRRRLRLILATDQLRSEVKQIIEYLNEVMETADVYALEIACYTRETAATVIVPHLIGATTLPMVSDGEAWTREKLQTAYTQIAEERLRGRLLALLALAVAKGFFAPTRAKRPTLRLAGRSGRRFLTFNDDGSAFLVLNEAAYEGGPAERDAVERLFQDVGLLGPNLSRGISGRKLRTLSELGDPEFRRLLAELPAFCGTAEE